MSDEIVCELKDVKWLIIGEKVLVDPRYINEYVASLKKESVGVKARSRLFIKAAVCAYCVGVAVHIFVMSG